MKIGGFSTFQFYINPMSSVLYGHMFFSPLSTERLLHSLSIAPIELAVSTRKFYTANTPVPSLPDRKRGPTLRSTSGYWVPCYTPKLETQSR